MQQMVRIMRSENLAQAYGQTGWGNQELMKKPFNSASTVICNPALGNEWAND